MCYYLSMTQKPLDAILKKKNSKVYITFIHLACRTVVKQGEFPDHCPWPVVMHWMQTQQETVHEWHLCDIEEATLDRASNAGFFGARSVLSYARAASAFLHLSS